MIKKQGPVVPLGVGTQLTYMPALDGIRAVSILGIMANHGGFGWATGGIISVNVFFVLSGFLITLLLMKEWTRSGTIRLRAFWARRARRLLPALFVLLGAIGLYALLFAPGGTQGSIRADGLSTLLYFSNWHEILANHSYFAQVSAPSPLLHTWTLAIEEQFYLVWPIVVICVLKLSRSPRVLFLVAALGVLASAAEMALLFHPGNDPSRIYYGTDTRAQDILTGAALGILLYSRQSVSSRRARAACSWMVMLAAAVFVWEWTRINGSPDIPYRGGFLLANVMVASGDLRCDNGTGQPSRSRPFRRAVDFRWAHLLRPISVALADIPCAQRGKDWPLRLQPLRSAFRSHFLHRRPLVVLGGDTSPAEEIRRLAIVGLGSSRCGHDRRRPLRYNRSHNQSSTEGLCRGAAAAAEGFFWSLCATGDQQHRAQFVYWRRSGKFNRCRSRRGLTCGGLVPRSLRCGKVRHHAPCRRQRTWLPRHPRSGHRTHAHRYTAMRCTPSAVPGSPCGSETEGRDPYAT